MTIPKNKDKRTKEQLREEVAYLKYCLEISEKCRKGWERAYNRLTERVKKDLK